MANSAKTVTLEKYNRQPGTWGRLRAVRAQVTFGADYAAAVLPLLTATQFGLGEVDAVIVEGGAVGTAAGASVVVAPVSPTAATYPCTSFTLKLFNGTTAIGTVDESATTVQITVLGY